MVPSTPIIAALLSLSHAAIDETSMMQGLVHSKTLQGGTDECRCPGYYQEQCEAEAAQGCSWSDAGSSNGPWCQCLSTESGSPVAPAPAPVLAPAPVPLAVSEHCSSNQVITLAQSDTVGGANIAAQAAGAVPFGSSSLPGYCGNSGAGAGASFGGQGIHCFDNVNDGLYGNSNSWIPGSSFDGKRFVGITFSEIQTISGISLARSRIGDYGDRTGGTYELQYTTAPSPSFDTPDAEWCSAGTFTRNTALLMSFGLSEPIRASAVRLIVSDAGACIDELEVYPPRSTDHCSSNQVITLAQSDAVGGANIAAQTAGAVPFGSSSLPGYCGNSGAGAGASFGGQGIHCFDNVNDGLYGNSNSWIPGSSFEGKRFVGITFSEMQAISGISLARSRIGDYGDRTGGSYELQYTTAPSPSFDTPDAEWCSAGTFTRDTALLMGFVLSDSIQASAVRLIVSDAGACIDELEVY